MSYSELSVNAREIVARFTLATTQEVELGLAWYPSAAAICTRMDNKYGVSFDVVAAVIAALSPNVKWEDNVIAAELMLKVYAAGGSDDDLNAITMRAYGQNQELATKILRAGDPSLLTGPKRQEFYNCIIYPLMNDVCIDTHAYSVWLGQRVTAKTCPNIAAIKLRARIKQDYHDACAFINEELGTTYKTADIQAITWVTHKRIHNV